MKNSKVIKAGVGYTVGNYLLRGISFLSVPIFARLLDQSDFGVYSLFLSYEGIIFVLLGFAIHSSYKNAKYKYTDEGGVTYGNYVSNSLLLVAISGAIWFAVFLIFKDKLSELLGVSEDCVPLLILFSYSTAIITCFNSDVGLEYKYSEYLKISAFNAIGNILFSIILIKFVFPERRYLGRIIGTVTPMFISAIIINIRTLRRAVFKDIFATLHWGLGYSLPIIPHGLSQIVLSSFDRIMISKMIGSVEAGIYSFAYTLYTILSVITTSCDTVWTSWFYEKMHADECSSIKRYGSYYVISICLLANLLVVTSPELILILGGEKYKEAIWCVPPIVAGGYFSFLYYLPVNIEYYYEKTKFIAIGTTTAATVNIILNYICIERFGYVAAAYTTLLTYLIYFLFHLFIAKSIEKRVIFRDEIFAICVIWMIISVVVVPKIVDHTGLRWFLALLYVIAFVWIEERSIGISRIVVKKVKGERNEKE